jgi:hypothetical protein
MLCAPFEHMAIEPAGTRSRAFALLAASQRNNPPPGGVQRIRASTSS